MKIRDIYNRCTINNVDIDRLSSNAINEFVMLNERLNNKRKEYLKFSNYKSDYIYQLNSNHNLLALKVHKLLSDYKSYTINDIFELEDSFSDYGIKEYDIDFIDEHEYYLISNILDVLKSISTWIKKNI